MAKLDNGIHDIIDKYFFYIAITVLLLLSVAIRLKLAPVTQYSSDYHIFLLPWAEHYRSNGIIEGLRQGVGNYYIPYNIYLAVTAQLPGEPWLYIALLSCICDYVMAYFVYRMALVLADAEKAEVGEWLYQKAVLAGVVTLYLPIVILDSALWKQCDSIYSTFIVISLYYVLREKYGRSLFWLGCGFVFKMQALFVLPLFVALYIFRKQGLCWWHFFWLPVWYVLGGLPAMLAGRGKREVLLIYFGQYNSGEAISENHPNLYRLVIEDYNKAMEVYGILKHPAIFGTVAVFAIFVCVSMKYKEAINKTNTIYIALWCVWTCVMFLPGMHDRFSYPVVVLLTMFVLVCDIRKLWLALVLNAVMTIIFSGYTLGGNSLAWATRSFFYAIPYFYVTYDLYRSLQAEARRLE
jgi:Gpi18-like mannosyltransferase